MATAAPRHTAPSDAHERALFVPFARELAAIRETTHATAERVARIEGTMERRGAPRA